MEKYCILKYFIYPITKLLLGAAAIQAVTAYSLWTTCKKNHKVLYSKPY